MKIQENITVYRCEHCNKPMFRKHAMVNHEKKCNNNPVNIRACYICKHLEKVNISYDGNTIHDDNMVKSSCFKCKLKLTFMHPVSFEYGKGTPAYVMYEGEEIIQEKMPLECQKMDADIYIF